VKTKRERKGLGVAQMIEDLPSKFKILSSNPSPVQKINERKERRKVIKRKNKEERECGPHYYV
jgi:hypothetical protein